MGRAACTEPQCLYKGALNVFLPQKKGDLESSCSSFVLKGRLSWWTCSLFQLTDSVVQGRLRDLPPGALLPFCAHACWYHFTEPRHCLSWSAIETTHANREAAFDATSKVKSDNYLSNCRGLVTESDGPRIQKGYMFRNKHLHFYLKENRM